MYTNQLLDSYKKKMNYVQDKQIAHDLGISNQKLSGIRNGVRYLTENEALFLANKIGAEKETILLYLAADKAKTYEAQQSWAQLIKKHVSQNIHMITMTCTAMIINMKPVSDYALCEHMLNQSLIQPINKTFGNKGNLGEIL